MPAPPLASLVAPAVTASVSNSPPLGWTGAAVATRACPVRDLDHNTSGAVSRRALNRGELAAALRTLAAERYLPPGSKTLRYFGVSTFERWLYTYRAHGLAGCDRRRAPTGAAVAS